MAEKSLTFNLFGKDVSASKAVGEFQTKASEHIHGLVKDLLGLSLGYIGVSSVIDFGKVSVEAALQAEKSNAKLSVALENTKSKYKANSDEVTNLKEKLAGYGFTGAQTADGLAVLTTGLGDSAKALDHMQLVADLAKYKNISLAESALVVAKGMEGQLRPLKALGIDLPVYNGNAQSVALANQRVADAQQKVNDLLAKYPSAADAASKHHAEYTTAVDALAKAQQVANDKASAGGQIIDALTQKVSGQAAKAAETYAGKWAAVNAKWDELQVKVGQKALPALGSLADFLDRRLLPGLDDAGKKLDAIMSAKTPGAQDKAIGSAADQFFKPWGNGWDQLMGKFGHGWSEWMGKFGHGWEQMTAKNQSSNGALGNGWDQLMGKFGNGWNQWKGKFDNGSDQMKDKFANGLDEMGTKFKHGWSQIQSGFEHGADQIGSAFDHGWTQIKSGWNDVVGSFQHGWQQIQDFFSGHPVRAQIIYSNVVPPAPSGGGGGSLVARPTATGGIFKARPGGHLLQVAEAGDNEAVIPLTDDNLRAMSGGGGGGDIYQYEIHFDGPVAGDVVAFGKAVYDAMVQAQKSGRISRAAFGGTVF